jgi:D-aminopeptidase
VRARDLGINIGDLPPGPRNAITDVGGIRVGHTTLIEGEGPLVVGRGPVRTGVTVVVPNDAIGAEPLFAGWHVLNGNGEVTGLAWVRESGFLSSPIALTNTHSVGVVRDALVAFAARSGVSGTHRWSLPVVAETWDGQLNDIDGMHVKPEHVYAALDSASEDVAEGNVGGGTGMVCHEFKGGIGTSSRRVSTDEDVFTVGVLVQANYGRRDRLRIDGVPVGRYLPKTAIPSPYDAARAGGSIIGIVATDAPLLPNQCDRLAQRAGLGVGRMGGTGAHTSGDFFVCFSTANRGLLPIDDPGRGPVATTVERLSDAYIGELFVAVIEATEEAILNAMLQAETMTGRDGITAHALPAERLAEIMTRYRSGFEPEST